MTPHVSVWLTTLLTVWTIVALFWAWHHTRTTVTVHPFKTWSLLALYYLSYNLWIWLLWIIYQFLNGQLNGTKATVSLICALLLIYARFIEPQLLTIKKYHVTLNPTQPLTRPISIVLIADMHIGLYSGHHGQLQRIINRINRIKPDCVVVAGDWTYEPQLAQLDHLVVFQQLTCPIYSVTGNHDEQVPGPPLRTELAQALAKQGIIDIENQIIDLDAVHLVGIGDLWSRRAQISHLTDFKTDKPMIVLAHNPDSVDLIPRQASKSLMLAGHTHGGQVYIPFATAWVLKKVSKYGHRIGYYQHDTIDVIVTAGTGMVGAPFRFLVPPSIDVIHLS